MDNANDPGIGVFLQRSPIEGRNRAKFDLVLSFKHIDHLQHREAAWRLAPNSALAVAHVLRKWRRSILDDVFSVNRRNAMLGNMPAIDLIPCEDQELNYIIKFGPINSLKGCVFQASGGDRTGSKL